jgi:putative flippase GtrA
MRNVIGTHGRRVAEFLLVGVGGAVVDLALFNSLVYWGGQGPMFDHPVSAKVIATLVATGATYVGNALLTYRDRSARLSPRRFAAYLVINALAIALQAGCLAVSRYVFGLEGQLADNLAGPVAGQVLATVFRYVTYPRWVFVADEDRDRL